jgi:hypothetical protein
VPGREHAERHVEVDVLVAVGVVNARSSGVGHEQRVGLVILERAGHPERQRPARAFVELAAARRARPVGLFFARPDSLDASPVDDGRAGVAARGQLIFAMICLTIV